MLLSMLLLLLPSLVLLLSCRMALLEVAMRKLLKNVVPADVYAARLVAVCLRPHLPRCVCVRLRLRRVWWAVVLC